MLASWCRLVRRSLLLESDFTPEALAGQIQELLTNSAQTQSMADAALGCAKPEAAHSSR